MNRPGPGGPGSADDGRAAAGSGAAARGAVPDLRRNDLAQMLDGAVHDLRTPLGAMSGWLEVIEAELGDAEGVLGKALAGLRRAIDDQARLIDTFGGAFTVLHEPFDPRRRTVFVERLVAVAGRLDPEARARIGSLAHLGGRSSGACIDGGVALDDGLGVFLRLLAAAGVDDVGRGATIDGDGEGIVVHLRSRPECVDSLLAFCNGLDRRVSKRAQQPLPLLWAARLALLESGLEPGARVARYRVSVDAAGAGAGAGAGPDSGAGADGVAGAGADTGTATEPAPVDMVIWLRLVGQPGIAPVDGAGAGDDGGPVDARVRPTARPAAGGLAAVEALAAGDVDGGGAPRPGPHALSLDAILTPAIDSIQFDPGLDAEARVVNAGLLPGAAATAAPGEEGGEGGSRTILIVDDQKDIREMLALWLRCHQFQVVVAGSAREARQRLAESGDVQAALIDIRMPEEDGISLLRSIRDREIERGERRMPALAITAQPSLETQASALQAGFSGMLSKPLRLRQLIELVENLH